MPPSEDSKRTAGRRALGLGAAAALLAASLAYAGPLISSRYILSIPVLSNGSANTASANYKIRTGVFGQGLPGGAQSANYRNAGGFVDRAQPQVNSAAADLSDAYVYPNPFKPNSPGSFRSDRLTFKRLPAAATIRIFAITGRQVAKLHKTDGAVDYYEWGAVNGGGEKLASGIYLYLVTAPGGGKAKGKFAVIR